MLIAAERVIPRPRRRRGISPMQSASSVSRESTIPKTFLSGGHVTRPREIPRRKHAGLGMTCSAILRGVSVHRRSCDARGPDALVGACRLPRNGASFSPSPRSAWSGVPPGSRSRSASTISRRFPSPRSVLIAFVILIAVSLGRVPLLPKRRADWLLLAVTGVIMLRSITASFSGANSMSRPGWRRSCRPPFRSPEWSSRIGFSRRTDALAAGGRRAPGHGRGGVDLRKIVRSRRRAGVLGRARDCAGRRGRGLLERAPETPRRSACSGHDRRLANVLRHRPLALVRPDSGGQSAAASTGAAWPSFACFISPSSVPR